MVFLFLTLFALFSSFSLSATAGDGKDEIQHQSPSSVTTLAHDVTPIGGESDKVNEETTPTSAASSSPSAAISSVTPGTVRSGKDKNKLLGAYLVTDTSLPPASYPDTTRPGVTVYREKNWTNRVFKRFLKEHPEINSLTVTSLPEADEFFEILYDSKNNFVELDIISYGKKGKRADFKQHDANVLLYRFPNLKRLHVSEEQLRKLKRPLGIKADVTGSIVKRDSFYRTGGKRDRLTKFLTIDDLIISSISFRIRRCKEKPKMPSLVTTSAASSSLSAAISSVTAVTAGNGKDEVNEERTLTSASSSPPAAISSATAVTAGNGKDEVNEERTMTSASSSPPAEGSHTPIPRRKNLTAGTAKLIKAYLVTDPSVEPISYPDATRPDVTVYTMKAWRNRVFRRFLKNHPEINSLTITNLPALNRLFEIIYNSSNNFIELDIEKYYGEWEESGHECFYAANLLKKHPDLTWLRVSKKQSKMLLIPSLIEEAKVYLKAVRRLDLNLGNNHDGTRWGRLKGFLRDLHEGNPVIHRETTIGDLTIRIIEPKKYGYDPMFR